MLPMAKITIRMKHTREWNHTYSNNVKTSNKYDLPALYNWKDRRKEVKEVELKIENSVGLIEGDLEKLLAKLRTGMFEQPIPEQKMLPSNGYNRHKY